MAALKMNLQLMRRYPLDRLERLDDSVQLVEDCITHLRERALSMRPAMLDELGLAQALRSHAARQSERSGVQIDVDVQAGFDAADDDWTSAIYRIVQEALRNALTHAVATRLALSLHREAEYAVLRVRDDGVGLRAAQGHPSEGIGLLTMRERTELLRGAFTLRAVEPRGAEVSCRWPLREVLVPAPARARAGGCGGLKRRCASCSPTTTPWCAAACD